MKRIHLTLTDQEALNLEVLCAKYGGSFQIQIRRLIGNAFEKEYGSYKATPDNKIKIMKEQEPEVDLTDEQTCEQIGGQCIKKQGVPYCLIKNESGVGFDWSWPLDDITNGRKIIKR